MNTRSTKRTTPAVSVSSESTVRNTHLNVPNAQINQSHRQSPPMAIDDVIIGDNERSDRDSCRNNTEKTRSHQSTGSVTSFATKQRKELEIKLRFARERQKYMNDVLQLEEAVEIAKLHDDDNEMSDEVIDVQSNRERVSNWVNNNHHHDISSNPDIQRTPSEIRFSQCHQFQDNFTRPEETRDNCLPELRRNAVNNHLQPYPAPAQFERVRPLPCDQQPNGIAGKADNMKNLIVRQSIPKELPSFTGNPLEWPNFITQFRSSSQICSFSNYENQIRLDKCLKGKAKEIVQALLIYPENVEKVITVLENRFGRPEFIIHQLLEKVRSFNPIKDDKLDLLINFSDIVNNLVYTLETLNEMDHIRNPILYYEVLNKLPVNHRLAFVEYRELQATNQPSLIDLREWLDRKVNVASKIMIPTFSDDNKVSKTSNSKSKAMTFAIIDKNSKTETKVHCCVYCNDDKHKIINCDKFKQLTVDERWTFVTQKFICFCCLNLNHSLKTCRQRKPCMKNNCKRVHNPLLHKEFSSTVQSSSQNTVSETNCNINESSEVLLKIIPIELRGPKMTIETFALLDEGSTVSLIDEGIANKLGLDGPIQPLRIQWTNNQCNEQDQSRTVSVSIRGKQSSDVKWITLRRVKTTNDMALPLQTVNVEEMITSYPYMKKFTDLSYNKGQPTILLGQDNWPVIVTRRNISGYWNGPTVSKTQLGWVVHGNLKSKNTTKTEFSFFHAHDTSNGTNSCDDLSRIHDLIKLQWNIDIQGTESGKEYELSIDDKKCIEILNNTAKKVGERYETGLLWKDENSKLPDSYNNAYRRLLCLEKKMDKNSIFSTAYINKFNEYVEKGYIKKLSKEETDEASDHLWYLPHFGVVNPNKPQKLRIVFDAASKVNGQSLNDFLLTGPDLYNSLPSMLINFRKNRIAFVGDIKEMFLQILIREEDRFCQRLLWRGSDREKRPDIYELQVLFFGEFEICNWVTNSEEVFYQIPENLRSQNFKDFKFDTDNAQERILGIWWNFKDDVFSYQFKFNKINPDIIKLEKRPTKRDILKIIMSIFDPLGLISNFLIIGKILMQNIWTSGIFWDDYINDNQFEYWKNWSTNFENISKIRIPRRMTNFPINECDIQLHLFCDASENAYATLAYLRFQYKEQINCTLINSKARVAPLKPTSIPRLELQAALIGARLKNYLINILDFQITNVFLWSDSKIVLYWIKSNTKRMKTYVAQRIGEIQELTNPMDWFYVPSKLNISDDATKIKSIDISKNNSWFNGPEFLYEPMTKWPQSNFDVSEIEFETNKETKVVDFVGVLTNKNEFIIPNVENFSIWNRFLRATAWMFQAIQVFKKLRLPGELQLEEILNAEIHIIKRIQQDSFSKELVCLRQGKIIPKTSKLNSFSCLIDNDNIIRVQGRLENSIDLNYETKHPIILDSKHKLTQLLIKFYHEKNNHQGVESIISLIRQKFWITNIRSAVKKSFYTCQYCRNRKAQPQIPKMGQLPQCRIDRVIRPFYKCGVDYFGPFEVAVNRKREKRYGVLFTCMTTRAIHLEIAQDLTSNSFIHVLRQFAARRGYPIELYSDNGSNFRKTEKDLKKAMSEWPNDVITQFCTTNNCKWIFNPPLAPHMGGVWERLIQSVKKHLSVILKEKHPKEFVLRTIFCEVEHILNSRPLTYNSVDLSDSEPITPNHFLIGPSYSCQQFSITDNKDLILQNMWKASQRLIDIFWKQWSREYIPSLLYNKKWLKDVRKIGVDDVVLIVDPDGPRNLWTKGIVIKVFPAKDGYIRVVDVKTIHGILRRPVSKIIKLELLSSNSL